MKATHTYFTSQYHQVSSNLSYPVLSCVHLSQFDIASHTFECELQCVLSPPCTGVYAGDTFSVRLPSSDKQVTVRCPEGMQHGRLLELRVFDDVPSETFVASGAPTPAFQYQEAGVGWGAAVCTLSWWIAIDVVLLGLLLAALTVPILSYQTIPGGCNTAADPPLPPRLYVNLWLGVGTTPECHQSDSEFCIRWTNKPAWSFIDGISGASMSYDVHYYAGTQTLLVIAAGVAFFALLEHLAVLGSLSTTTSGGRAVSCRTTYPVPTSPLTAVTTAPLTAVPTCSPACLSACLSNCLSACLPACLPVLFRRRLCQCWPTAAEEAPCCLCGCWP
jgi:hypothetical protein